MRLLVESLAELDPVNKPITPADLSGRWELLYTTVELFRASPFFQMVRNREERRKPVRGSEGVERHLTHDTVRWYQSMLWWRRPMTRQRA